MERIFLILTLAQHAPADTPAIILRDRDGNEQILDGLHHTEPHGMAVIELEAHDGVIDFPGWLTRIDKSNALPVSADNPRLPPQPARFYRDTKGRTVELGSIEQRPAEGG